MQKQHKARTAKKQNFATASAPLGDVIAAVFDKMPHKPAALFVHGLLAAGIVVRAG